MLDLESTGKNFASIAEKLGELLIEWGHTGVEKATKLKGLWCQKHRYLHMTNSRPFNQIHSSFVQYILRVVFYNHIDTATVT